MVTKISERVRTKQRGQNAQPCGFYHFPCHIWLKWDFCYDLMLPKQGKRLLSHTMVIYHCTSLKCLPIFRSSVTVSKHIHHIELEQVYGNNGKSRMKRG